MVLPRSPWSITVHHVNLRARARHLHGHAHCFHQRDIAAADDPSAREQLKAIHTVACKTALHPDKGCAHFNNHGALCMITITNAGQRFLPQHPGTELDRHNGTKPKHAIQRVTETRGD